MRGHILTIEDDPVLASHIHAHLIEHGFAVDIASEGREGLAQACQGQYDLILMDIMLPGINGLEILSTLRKSDAVPVLLMSALGAEENRIAGFSQGADDFLPKPFSLQELKVRIEAILRRVEFERRPKPAISPSLALDETRRDLSFNGQWAGLTESEFRLLQVLSAEVDEPMTKAYLYQRVLNRPLTEHDRVLDMHVSHLRRKLRAIDYQAGRIETVWGVGYVYRTDP